ncbi:transposase [Nocardia sp. NPDC047654]|uniref:transposase n=1 Tax=Nocardia sp. NPDC047654 TaxID=3364314 RepID=UPI00371CBA14
MGRSREGLSTKIHLAADGAGRGLAVLLTPGQTNDSPPLLDAVVVPRLAGGAPRRNPEVVIADRAYSAASNRSLLCHKRIQTAIPERITTALAGVDAPDRGSGVVDRRISRPRSR